MTCLGHVVGKGRVLPRQAKVQSIVDFPKPGNKRELMRFLGMSGFYRKFCANYSTLVVPLTDLLKRDAKFVWSERCQNAFDRLKAVLACSPVLVAPDFDKPFKLAVDASCHEIHLQCDLRCCDCFCLNVAGPKRDSSRAEIRRLGKHTTRWLQTKQ